MKNKRKLIFSGLALIAVCLYFSFWNSLEREDKETKILLRNKPLRISMEESTEKLGLDPATGCPEKYVDNRFIDNNDGTVTDETTGLMWRKCGGEDDIVTYDKAKRLIENLNQTRFAGYKNWRLPTVPELITLLEEEQMARDQYIDPVLGFYWHVYFWSADIESEDSAWFVGYEDCCDTVYFNEMDFEYLVCAVRTIR